MPSPNLLSLTLGGVLAAGSALRVRLTVLPEPLLEIPAQHPHLVAGRFIGNEGRTLHIHCKDMKERRCLFSPVLTKDLLVLRLYTRIGCLGCSTVEFAFPLRSLKTSNGTVQGAARIA